MFSNATNFNRANDLAMHRVIDNQHQDLPVAMFRHPQSWQSNSRIDWNFAHYSHPCLAYANAFNPNGSEGFEVLPTESLYWLEPNYGNPIRQNKFGQTCLPVTSAAETMTRWILPKYRGRCQNLRIVNLQNISNLPQMLNDGSFQQLRHENVMVRIEYTENGREFEEEFYGIQVVHDPPNSGGYAQMTQINWGFARLFCFRAEKGKLDLNRNIFWQIAASWQVNPNWQNLYGQILKHLHTEFNRYIQMGYDQINAATQMSRMYLAQHRQSVQQQQNQFNSNWQAWDDRRHQEHAAWNNWENKIEGFGDAMMGRETYNDPYYQYGSQHYGYHNYVWTDGQGNYQYSNDANFDPNINLSVNWQIMEKKK
jgi:hypothetical protein